jgi:hypothetical protein
MGHRGLEIATGRQGAADVAQTIGFYPDMIAGPVYPAEPGIR